VERIYQTANATLAGSDEADELTIFNSDGSSKLYGRGGDDKLSAFDMADTLDGGAGADTIEGGYGDDTITGGPGRDMINADVAGTSCHYIQCRMPYGNDTVDVRDGEADNVTCGIGTDVVTADPADTVAPDCETVNVGAASSQQGAQPPKQGRQTGGKGGPSLTGVRARRSRGVVIVAGRARGVAAVSIKASRGGRRVARAKARVRAGRFMARLRVGRARVRVTVAAGSAKRTLSVR